MNLQYSVGAERISRHSLPSKGNYNQECRIRWRRDGPLNDSLDQSALILGLQTGDRGAWTTLYDRYNGDVWRFVARLLGPRRTDVADVVQETFLAAARSARQFNPAQGTLWAWLTGIAHHRVCQFWRQANRQSKLRELAEAGTAELQRWLESTEPLPADWQQAERVDLLRATLAEISADYAELLTAKYLDDTSLQDLAMRRQASPDAIKSKLARARAEFRAKFEHLARGAVGSAPVQQPVSGK